MFTPLRSFVVVALALACLAIGCAKEPPAPKPDPAIGELRAQVKALSDRVAVLEQRLDSAPSREIARRDPTAVPEAPPEVRRELQEALDGIEKKGPNRYLVPKQVFELAMAQPALIARGARVVPSIKKGKPNGFKLYAIRPGTLFERVGFEDGDTLHAINGHRLDGLDQALETYDKLRSANKLVVELSRRGVAKKLTIEIEK